MAPAASPAPPVEEVPASASEATPSGKRPYKKREPAVELPSVVKMNVDDFTIPDAAATKEYHVGTLDSCPFQNVTLAGVSFPRFSGGSAIGDPQRRGARARLSADNIESIKKSLGRKICRWRKGPDGSRVGGVVLSINPHSGGFRLQAGDEWLAKHVYCVEMKPELTKIMDENPEAMA